MPAPAGVSARGDAAERGAGETASESLGRLWSGRIRCNVTDTMEARAAVTHIVWRLARDYCCEEAALETVARLFHSYQNALQCMVASFSHTVEKAGAASGPGAEAASGPGAEAGAPPDSSEPSMQQFMASVLAAARGVAALVADAIEPIADAHVLRRMVCTREVNPPLFLTACDLA